MRRQTTKKLDPDFVIRLVGPDVKPWVVPMRALSRVLDSVQRLVDQNEEEESEELADEEEEGDVAPSLGGTGSLRLVGVKSQSAGYAIASQSRDSVLRVLSQTGEAIRAPQRAEWTASSVSSIRSLSEVAKSLGVEIEFRTPGKGNALGGVIARITPISYAEVSGTAFVHGPTSVYATLERIGGVTEPRCALRVPDQHRLVFCDVSGKLVREMGRYLYQDIVVSGEATWLRCNWHLKGLKIASYEPPKTGSIRDLLGRMYKAGGYGWDGVARPDEEIREMRG